MKKTFILILLFLISKPILAQNSYVGEVKLFAGNFAPDGWAFCDGNLLTINQNSILFALIGNTYGGDGVNNFAVPDLRSRIPVGQGQGQSGRDYVLGQNGGTETISLVVDNLPSHSHQSQLQVSSKNATLSAATPTAAIATAGSLSGRILRPNLNYNTATPDITLQTITTGVSGISGAVTPISLVKPSLCLNYIIALIGYYPSQN